MSGISKIQMTLEAPMPSLASFDPPSNQLRPLSIHSNLGCLLSSMTVWSQCYFVSQALSASEVLLLSPWAAPAAEPSRATSS